MKVNFKNKPTIAYYYNGSITVGESKSSEEACLIDYQFELREYENEVEIYWIDEFKHEDMDIIEDEIIKEFEKQIYGL